VTAAGEEKASAVCAPLWPFPFHQFQTSASSFVRHHTICIPRAQVNNSAEFGVVGRQAGIERRLSLSALTVPVHSLGPRVEMKQLLLPLAVFIRFLGR